MTTTTLTSVPSLHRGVNNTEYLINREIGEVDLGDGTLPVCRLIRTQPQAFRVQSRIKRSYANTAIEDTLMAMFVHLTADSLAARIQRNGISRLRKPVGASPRGVFAVPVTRNFYASHQWLRELKRRNKGPLVGVYFRVPDEERVWVGHYGQTHRWLSAAEAIAEFARADDPFGWQVVIPRRIEPNEIHKTRRLRQVIGWRFHPNAKGKPPFCTCKFCTRGEHGAAKLRKRLGTLEDQ